MLLLIIVALKLLMQPCVNRVLPVMKCSSDFTKEVVTLHVFCHVQMTECEVTVMMGDVTETWSER